MELAYQTPPIDAPRAWCFGPETICQRKLEQHFERSGQSPAKPLKLNCLPVFTHTRFIQGGIQHRTLINNIAGGMEFSLVKLARILGVLVVLAQNTKMRMHCLAAEIESCTMSGGHTPFSLRAAPDKESGTLCKNGFYPSGEALDKNTFVVRHNPFRELGQLGICAPDIHTGVSENRKILGHLKGFGRGLARPLKLLFQFASQMVSGPKHHARGASIGGV